MFIVEQRYNKYPTFTFAFYLHIFMDNRVCVTCNVSEYSICPCGGMSQTKEEEKLVDSFLEGDIRLTVEQAEHLLSDARKPRRRKRKLAEPASKSWSLPIPYTFDGSHS